MTQFQNDSDQASVQYLITKCDIYHNGVPARKLAVGLRLQVRSCKAWAARS